MKKIFGNKKNIYAIIAVLLILACIIAWAVLGGKTENVDTEKNVGVSEIEKEPDNVKNEEANKEEEKQDKEEKSDEKENDVKEEQVETKAKKETESVEIPYLEEDETLEDVINDFNSLPEGEDKEAAREKLEKIFEFAEENSAKSNE